MPGSASVFRVYPNRRACLQSLILLGCTIDRPAHWPEGNSRRVSPKTGILCPSGCWLHRVTVSSYSADKREKTVMSVHKPALFAHTPRAQATQTEHWPCRQKNSFTCLSLCVCVCAKPFYNAQNGGIENGKNEHIRQSLLHHLHHRMPHLPRHVWPSPCDEKHDSRRLGKIIPSSVRPSTYSHTKERGKILCLLMQS